MIDLLADLVPGDMDVPPGRLKEVNISNVSWLCRNIQVRNGGHPEIKQTLAKLNMLRQKIALGQMTMGQAFNNLILTKEEEDG